MLDNAQFWTTRSASRNRVVVVREKRHASRFKTIPRTTPRSIHDSTVISRLPLGARSRFPNVSYYALNETTFFYRFCSLPVERLDRSISSTNLLAVSKNSSDQCIDVTNLICCINCCLKNLNSTRHDAIELCETLAQKLRLPRKVFNPLAYKRITIDTNGNT